MATVVSFAQEEIFKVGNVLNKLVTMIPNEKENKEILKELVEANNIVTKGIKNKNKNKNLKGASALHLSLQQQPCFSVMYDHNYGIKNLCKKFGLANNN